MFAPSVFDVEPVGASAWDAAPPTPAVGAFAPDHTHLRSLEASLKALKAGKRRKADDRVQLTALIVEQLIAAPSHAAHRGASERAAAEDIELASLLGRSSSGGGGGESGSEIAAVTPRCIACLCIARARFCIACLSALDSALLALREWSALRRRRQIFARLASLEEEPDDMPSSDSDDDGWQS